MSEARTLSSPGSTDLQVVTPSLVTLRSLANVDWGIFWSEGRLDEVAEVSAPRKGERYAFSAGVSL